MLKLFIKFKSNIQFFFIPGDDDKLSVLHPSATGSLSSITTTSLVSEQGASDGAGSDRGDDRSEKQLVGIKHEKWWHTTIQVAIPFFIAGIGTIGAGIILGRVEVSSMEFLLSHNQVQTAHTTIISLCTMTVEVFKTEAIE